MARERTIVGIDVGTGKVCTLVADASAGGPPHVIGVGLAPTTGMRKGMVVDVEQVVESIVVSLEKAERESGRRVEAAHVSFTGAHVASLNNRGVVAVARDDRTITPDDVERAVDAARVVNLPANREIIHAVPRQFIVDGQDGIRNPVGMLGSRLDVEAHIVTGAATAVQNLVRCVEQAGVEPLDLVLNALASADAVLTREERDMGVALLDVGAGTAALTVFADGSPIHTAVIGVGGYQVTNDIGVGLRTPFHEAEELKIAHGRAMAAAYGPDETVRVTTFGGSEAPAVAGRELGLIVEARLTELLQFVGTELTNSGHAGRLSAGVVMTGGAALLRDFTELGQVVLGLPCRIGRPGGVLGLRDAVAGPMHATAVGLITWASRDLARVAVSRSSRFPVFDRTSRPADGTSGGARLRSWLRAFLP